MPLKDLSAVAFVGLINMSGPVFAQTNATGAQVVHQLNTDPSADQTLSWEEVRPAAEARFKQLDVDYDGTLSQQEAAKAGITSSEFDQANTTGTHTLSQQEYLDLVQARFKAANGDPNTDQTLSSQELDSAAGQKLVKLLDIKGSPAHEGTR
jgi:hypothetical protein